MFKISILKYERFFFIFSVALILLNNSCVSEKKDDSIMIKNIFDETLVNSECYDNLRILCKNIGPRLSGSPEAAKAVEWGEHLLKKYGLDKVYLQDVMVPHWIRGEKEKAAFIDDNETVFVPNVCALGGSVGTDGQIEAGIIEVHNVEELAKSGKTKIEGKFVFYNRPMNPTYIDTFKSYETCVDQRSKGAVEAAKYGAVGVLVRSMNLKIDRFPHTGTMKYEDGVKKIPAAAVSTEDAEYLSKLIEINKNLKVSLTMDCKTLPDENTFNVIGEITGAKYPDKIIAIGGHIDSWDITEGAHDDGAGVVQSVEVIRTFKALGYKPNHTLRVVMFMNEENGTMGGKTYAKIVDEKKEIHVAAIESDSGAFSPRGFTIDGPSEKISKIQKWKSYLEPYNLHKIEKGFGGVDIGPLRKVDANLLLIGLLTDS